MYQLEIKVARTGVWETYHFPTVEKVLDYIYMVEGETLLPEYRTEFQRNAPSEYDIKCINRAGFVCWQVADIKYVLSKLVSISRGKHRKYTFPKRSKFWGTVYGVDSGAERARVEKSPRYQ